ncbi:MAG: InlB B-repeat-containing protein, partial [Mycoplasmatales bacterium]
IWTAKKFEVSFDGNGGTTPTPVTAIVPFEELIKVPTAPTRTGYAFVGWNTSTDGKGTSWDFSTMAMPAKNFTLYAIWQGNKQNLNFDVNGGTTPAPVKQVVFVGQLATQVSNPTRTGYTFIEWNTKIDGTGETWDFAASKIGTTDTTLYAQWIPEKKQVTFEMNGGDTPAPQVQSVEVNAQIISPSNPTKTGNLFVGWNTKSDGTGKTWDFSTDLMPTTDLSLYAIWNPKKLNLSFDVNGGETSSPVSQVVEYSQKASPVTNPRKTGYTFNGWNNKVDQSGTMWDFNSSTMPATDLTLYATWTPIKTVVNFDVNGASSPIPPETQVDPGTTVNEPVDPVRAGFRFVGWNTELDGSGITWNFMTTEVETTPVKLYAQWQPDIYNLVFNVNGASTKTPVGQEIPFGELATKVTDPVRAGYVFKEWNTKIDGSGDTWDFSLSTMPATEVTLYAKWTPAKYELSFDTAGGNTPPVSQTLEVQKFATSVKAPTKVGSSFIGWNTKLDGSGRSWNFTTTKMPAQDTKLFAQWETLKYNLSFNVNGGETATPATQTIAFENLATAVNTPTRTGFTFKEWNTKLDGTGKKWDFSSTKMQAFDQELYAVWTPNEIELSFDSQGGTPTPISQILPVLSLATKPVEPTKAGHTFTGWNTKLDGTGKSWNFSSSKMEFTPVKLFAIWTPKSYNVTFDPSGATAIDIPPQTVEFEKMIDEPTKLVRTGYIFKEWQTPAGTKWDFKSSKMQAGDLKLKAIWTPIEYQLKFDGNSSPDNIPTQTVPFEQLAKEPKAPENIGYSFTGWNTLKDGSGTTWNFTSNKMPAKDLVLYAQWQPNNYNLTFNLAGGDKPQPELQSIPFNSLSTEPKEPIKVGYTFKEWQTPTGTKWDFATNKMPGNNLQLTAVWIPNKYKLSFDITSGSGTPPPVQAVEYTKLATKPADPIKVGYSFVGWNTELDGSGSYWNFNTTKMNNKDQKLYAQYMPKQYLVTFVNKTPYAIKYLKYTGEQIEQPKDPNVAGYIFKGWFDQEVGGQKLDITTFKMPAKDLTIYAQYEKINYNVIFNDRGKEIKQVVPFDELVKEPVVPTKIGFTFTGWKTKIDGTEKTWDFAKDKMPANDLTLYSTFEPTKYKLKFISKNGTIEKTMKYNETITPPNPEIKGQRFIGWFTTETGGENWDFTKAKMPAGNLTLYAQYEETKPAIAKTGTISVGLFALLIFICIVSGLFMARRFISSKS